MDVNLTDEQQMMVDSAREFLRDACPLATVRDWEKLPDRYPREIWARMAEMGWTGAIYPEAFGGLGLTNLDMALLMREMGRVALPSPILSTVLLAGRAGLLQRGATAVVPATNATVVLRGTGGGGWRIHTGYPTP